MRGRGLHRDDQIDTAPKQVRRQFRKARVLPFRRSYLDLDVLPLDIPKIAECLTKRAQGFRASPEKEADPTYPFALLRARRRARFRASTISAFTRVFRRAMRAHSRVAALAARFARQRGPCRDRPRERRATSERNERAPVHSITSSARATSVGDTARPSAFAVLRLITSSRLVGNSIGRSPGPTPLRILCT